jgi:LPXTG-motif cell wall-anchored protein
MPTVRHRAAVALLTLAAALATVPSAGAQTPGDEQYTDPFGSDGSSSATPTPTPTPAAPPATTPPPSAAAPAAAPPAAPAASSAQAAPAAQAQPQLPYTGSPVGAAVLAAAGGVLLAGGLTLRVRLRERDGA